ncbi:mitochondrial import receptor subunit tom-70-like protein, partial [Leptotrombidium deliense]
DFSTVDCDIVVHTFICLANTKGKRLIKEGFGMDFALQCFERAISAMPEEEHEDIYYHRAKLYIESGQFNNARKDLKKSVECDANFIVAKCEHLRLKFELAFNTNKMKDKKNLLRKFDELSNEFNDSCTVFATYAEVLTLIGNYEEAIKK